MKLISKEDYLKKCMSECGDKIDPSLHTSDSIQKNALRVETIRDKCARCGNKIPKQWSEGAKKAGWGRWIFSGGPVSVFGACESHNCPKINFFLRHAPYKHLRNMALDSPQLPTEHNQ